jgi:hypothetical protein
MDPTHTVFALALLGVFAAGYALGCITPLIRGLSSASVKSVKPAVSSTTRLYELKCKCGEVLEFRDPHDSGTSGLPPLPGDDVYSCPKCDAAINLRQIREMMQKQIASLEQSRR